jgi:predicted CopG family antitoxin
MRTLSVSEQVSEKLKKMCSEQGRRTAVCEL